MYLEPYGYLDLENLEIYIRSQQDCDKVANVIKTCLTSIDRFLSGITATTELNNSVYSEVMTKFNIKSIVKAKGLCNRFVNTGTVGDATVDKDILARIIDENSTSVYSTRQGAPLTNFQNKFIEFVDVKMNGVTRGSKEGLEVYLDVIDKAVMRSTKKPYLLGRFVSAIVDYVSFKPILDMTNTNSRAELAATLKQVEDFEDNYLKQGENEADNTIDSLVQRDNSLRHLLGNNVPKNTLVGEYMRSYVSTLDHEYINKQCGTNLDELEMYKELIELEKLGLSGFSLPASTLLDSLNLNGIYYERDNSVPEGLEDNKNIRFIVGPLKKMLASEINYREI